MIPRRAFDPAQAFLLPLPFELCRPALFAAPTGSAALQETLPYVPGATLLGALAQRWIQTHPGLNPGSAEEFRRLFVDGSVRYLNAYPEQPDLPGQRLLPVPRSIRQVKDSGELRDLAAGPSSDGRQLVSAAGDRDFGAWSSGQLRLVGAEARIAEHVARAKDRARGRATEVDGALFAYEALAPNQRFVAAALGARPHLDVLRTLVGQPGQSLRIGRSATAEYGGAPRFDEPLPQLLPFQSERLTIHGETPTPALDDGRLVVTLTAPLLAVDDRGEPTLDFPTAELAQVLLEAGWLADRPAFELIARFQASTPVGGFSLLWKLPKPAWPAIAAGSVFVFSSPHLKPNETGLAAIEWSSLGLRTTEGFGRFAVGAHGAPGARVLRKASFNSNRPARPAETVPEAVKVLAEAITRDERLELARLQATRRAEHFAPPPSGSLASQLSALGRLAVDEAGFTQAREVLRNLRTPARTALEGCRIREGGPSGLNATLFDHLDEVFNLANAWQPTRPGSAEVQPIEVRRQELGLPQAPEQTAIRRERQVYLLTLAAVLRRRATR